MVIDSLHRNWYTVSLEKGDERTVRSKIFSGRFDKEIVTNTGNVEFDFELSSNVVGNLEFIIVTELSSKFKLRYKRNYDI